jgi:NodT family efflux transporter outer membrane factor (OMF) lipoprotein
MIPYAFALLLLLSGCFCTEKRADPLPLPSCSLEKAVATSTLPSDCNWLTPDWWCLFGDPQLNRFIQLSLERNPTFHTAQANILHALADAERLRAALFPTLFWFADISRQKLSKTGVIPFGNINIPFVQAIPVYFTQFETYLTLNYEFDLWGKNRNTLRAALGEVQSAIADAAFSKLQLTISLASAYLHLQTLYQRERIVSKRVENKNRFLELVALRGKEISNDLNLFAAQADLADTQEYLTQIRGEIAITEDQVRAYLAGCFDEPIEKVAPLPPPLPLPQELPLHLLAHRPDIASQLWLIYSAGRAIESAKAGFYPDLNLSALFGFQTLHFKELFRWESSYFNINPAISLPIFDGGRLVANLHGNEVNYDLAIFHYNELLLGAVHEVLDGIALVQNAYEQWKEYEMKYGALGSSFHLRELRLEKGIDNELDTRISLDLLLQTEDQKMMTLDNILQAQIALIKSLGGGYDIHVGY